MSASSNTQTTPTKSMRSRMGSLLRRSSSAISFTRPGNSSRRSSSESLRIEPPGPEHASKLHVPSPVVESPVTESLPQATLIGPSPLSGRPRALSKPIDIPQKSPPPEAEWGDGPVTVTPEALSSVSHAAVSEPSESIAPSTQAEEGTTTAAQPQATEVPHAESSSSAAPGSESVDSLKPALAERPNLPEPSATPMADAPKSGSTPDASESEPAEPAVIEPTFEPERVLSPPAITVEQPTPIATVVPVVADLVVVAGTIPGSEPSSTNDTLAEDSTTEPFSAAERVEPPPSQTKPDVTPSIPSEPIEVSLSPAELVEMPAPTTEAVQAEVQEPANIQKKPSMDNRSLSHNPWTSSTPGSIPEPANAAPVAGQQDISYFDLRSPSERSPTDLLYSAGTTPRPYVHAKPDKAAATIDQLVETVRRSRASTMSSQARPVTPPPAFATNGASKASVAPSVVDRTDAVIIVEHGGTDSSIPSMVGSYTDPFADQIAGVPEAMYYRGPASFDPAAPAQPVEPANTSIGVQGGPQWNVGDQPEPQGFETDETLPLLQAPRAPGERSSVYDPSMVTDFSRRGWRMHVLPDTSVYFTNANLRVVSDADLRQPGVMRQVSEYLDSAIVPPHGWELWLRHLSKGDSDLTEHFWIHHDKCIIIKPSATVVEETMKTEDERLSVTKAYWHYVETHPAHIILSAQAIGEATDILTWAYTDRLLPSSPRNKSPAFTQEECHELSEILRSIDTTNSPSQILMRTRVVAKIMHRMCVWRQGKHSVRDYFFRHEGAENPRRLLSFPRRVADIAITAACFGLPYFFSDRARSAREDRTGANMRGTASSMLVVGAVACMIAAVILGASVTLISLPGVNELSRIASFVSIILSASSLVSAILVIMQWKTTMDRHTSYNSYNYYYGEGVTYVSRRSLALSLPFVFLIWAIAAFITAAVLHMLRGFLNNGPIPRQIQKYVQWAVVGGVGGVVGMLFACGLILL